MDIAKVPSRNAFQVTEVHLGDRKVCSWLGTQFFFPWSLSFLKGLAGSSCLHCLPIPQVLGCWNYRLLFYRNSEPCALKMHDLQSVIKGRINCRLPVTNEIQKVPKVFFKPPKILGTIFATLLLTFSIYSASPGLHSLQQRQKLFSTSLEKIHSEWTSYNQIWG